MAHIIAVATQKGGAGKSTLTINLAAALAEQRRRVLVIDLDPQANSTECLGVDLEEPNDGIIPKRRTVASLLTDDATALADVVHPTNVPNVDIVPATIELEGAELVLATQIGGETVLEEKLSPLTGYDFVLIDCRPTLGKLTNNALVAAHSILIPVDRGKWALAGLGELFATIRVVQRRLNPRLVVRGIVFNKVKPGEKQSAAILEYLQTHYADLLLKTHIKEAAIIDQAHTNDAAVIRFDPNSESADAFRSVATELLTSIADDQSIKGPTHQKPRV